MLEGTAVATHNSIQTLRKVVLRGRVVSGPRDHINRALEIHLCTLFIHAFGLAQKKFNI